MEYKQVNLKEGTAAEPKGGNWNANRWYRHEENKYIVRRFNDVMNGLKSCQTGKMMTNLAKSHDGREPGLVVYLLKRRGYKVTFSPTGILDYFVMITIEKP